MEEWRLGCGFYPRNKKISQRAGMGLVIVNLNLNLQNLL